jgi:DNA-binding protein HU-beta
MIQHLQNGETITIQGFGSFEIRKKTERISINPATKKRMFVPPKLIVTYKPSTSLKDKLK